MKMSETDFIELVTDLANSDCCTGEMGCDMDNTSLNERVDCANCWAKRLSNCIEI
ncbi:hypothetical protein [Clostridium gasigenes]|uniref:hypothetical protein n=1 Tax=Clostridium gasigenes TaxID=94869 RepID=UPI001C0CD785|nr:hypothetical protein [Clostridium gasigenes]MBU3102972.1 hypothetical protein [Clostridium gasigenes]